MSRCLPLICGMIAALAFSPAGADEKQTEIVIASPTLAELAQTYLDVGNEGAFWEQIRTLSEAGQYPLVEDIRGDSAAPEDYVRLTFLHKRVAENPANVILFASINRVLAEELLFARIEGTNVYFKSVEVPPGVRFEYRIHENDPLTSIYAGAKYGTRMHLLPGDPDPFNRNRKVHVDGLGAGVDYIETWVELPGARPQPYRAELGNPEGTILEEVRPSTRLGYSHRILCYLPPATMIRGVPTPPAL